MKPMTSPVNWALLGLLIKSSGYGYQLMQQFERAYGAALPLSSESHVYTALNELRRRGLIEEVAATTVRSGTDRQPKRRYRATERGALSYREWMLAQVGVDRRQSWLFVRQLAVFEHDPDVALEILDLYENECLREARRVPESSELVSRGSPASELADRLILEEGRLAMEGRLLWVEYARDAFRALRGRRSDESARA